VRRERFGAAGAERQCAPAALIRLRFAPFRRLHKRYLEQQLQERVERAARWAHEQGGSEDSIAEAGLRCFGGSSPEISECIRQALPGVPSDRPRGVRNEISACKLSVMD